MEGVGDERWLRGGSCQPTNRARRSPALSEGPGQPRTLSRTCHSHYGLQRGPSRPWLTCCCGCVCPHPAHGTCLPLCTAAHGQSHGHCNPHAYNHTFIHSLLFQGPAVTCAILGMVLMGTHACAHPCLHTMTFSSCPTYAHVHTNSTVGTWKYVLTPTLSTPAHLSHLQAWGSNYRRGHLVSTSHTSDSVLRTF